MEGYKEHSINERIADIARTLFGGNISLMARKTFIARNTISSIIKSDGVTPGYDIINKIAEMASPRISLQWLVRGEGDMIENTGAYANETRPRIPVRVTAGTMNGFADAVKENECELMPVIRSFPNYDYTIVVKGNSMEPKYEGGDELAIKKVDSIIEWGKVYVLDTRDGAVLKRLYEENEDEFRCVSYNKEYSDFRVSKSEVFAVYKVVGLIRI